MSTTAPIQQANTASSRKMLQAMVGIGILCALLIVLTYEGTLSRIETNKAEASASSDTNSSTLDPSAILNINVGVLGHVCSPSAEPAL